MAVGTVLSAVLLIHHKGVTKIQHQCNGRAENANCNFILWCQSRLPMRLPETQSDVLAPCRASIPSLALSSHS